MRKCWNRIGVVVAAVALAIVGTAGTASAGTFDRGGHEPLFGFGHNDHACITCVGVVTPAQFQPPAGSVLVVNVSMNISNDEDSGNVGYWALDNYTKTIKVWQKGSTFYAGVLYDGTWQTFAGALSPEVGVVEPGSGSGQVGGGYIATLTGSLLTHPTKSTYGYIGGYNLGGTKADVLKGSYASGQVGDPAPVSWLNFYFTPATIATFAYSSWGWQYNYAPFVERQTQNLPEGHATQTDQTDHTAPSVWCNTLVGTSGDIVVMDAR